MKVTITQACYVDGKPCKAGDVVDTARFALLIGSGKATKYVEPEQAPAKEPAKDAVKEAAKEPQTRVPVDQQNRSGNGSRNGK